MFAFLRSNLYPASIAQNPELRSRLGRIRFGLVSTTAKMRANVNAGNRPLCDIERDPVVLAEILLKELKFCDRTINFIHCVATKYRDVAFTNVDDVISDLEAQAQNNRPDGCEQSYKQAHSAQLWVETTDIKYRFSSLCDSLGACLIGLTGANDSDLFASIHSRIAMSDDVAIIGYFDSMCDISRAAWNMMTVMAFAHLYHYYFQPSLNPLLASTHPSNPSKPGDANPGDAIFASKVTYTCGS